MLNATVGVQRALARLRADTTRPRAARRTHQRSIHAVRVIQAHFNGTGRVTGTVEPTDLARRLRHRRITAQRTLPIAVAGLVLVASFAPYLPASSGPTGGPTGDGPDVRLAIGGAIGLDRTGHGVDPELLGGIGGFGDEAAAEPTRRLDFRPLVLEQVDIVPDEVTEPTGADVASEPVSGPFLADETLVSGFAPDTTVEDGSSLKRGTILDADRPWTIRTWSSARRWSSRAPAARRSRRPSRPSGLRRNRGPRRVHRPRAAVAAAAPRSAHRRPTRAGRCSGRSWAGATTSASPSTTDTTGWTSRPTREPRPGRRRRHGHVRRLEVERRRLPGVDRPRLRAVHDVQPHVGRVRGRGAARGPRTTGRPSRVHRQLHGPASALRGMARAHLERRRTRQSSEVSLIDGPTPCGRSAALVGPVLAHAPPSALAPLLPPALHLDHLAPERASLRASASSPHARLLAAAA